MKGIGVRLLAIAAAVIVSGSLAVPAAAEKKEKTHLQFGGSSENDDWEFNRQAEDNQYFLPDADTYFITEQNISWMDDDQLVLARNEFFARRGRKFSTKWIQEYFDKQKWYHGRIAEKRFTANLFNAYETANVNFIINYEQKRKEKRKSKVTRIRFTGPNEVSEEYNSIYNQYNDAALSGWDSEHSSAVGLRWIVDDKDIAKTMSYTCMDLDGDGKDEFIVGSTDKKKFGEGAVFAVYTLVDGAPKRLIQSDGNISYFICEDHRIRREETSDDGRWTIGYFELRDGSLECTSLLVMDENENSEKPWYALEVEQKLQGFEITDENGAQQDTDGTEAFNLSKVPEDQIGSVGVEMLNNVTYEKASEMRTAHTGEELEMVPFTVEDD